MMKQNWLTALFFTLVFVLCSINPAPAATTLILADDSPPMTMDPHAANTDANSSVMTNLFDGLLARTGKDGLLVPALAERFERKDLNTWVFYLRKGVKFHNGNPFTAEDVKFSLERLADPSISKWLPTGKGIASIDTPDDFTVVVKTKSPTPWFANNLHQIFIMDKESTENRDSGDLGQNPIGTGAYKLVEWVKGSHLKFEANEDYWGGAPKIKTVELRPISESSTRFASLVSGSVDLVSSVPVELFEKLKKNPNVDVITRPSRRAIYLAMGNKAGTPLADVRVRKAMYMAINEDEIIDKVMRGLATPTAQLPDPACVGYNPDLQRYPYNPDQAKKLLVEAGYPDGFEITLAGPNDRYTQDSKIAEAAVQYLNKVGIKAKLDVKPKSIFFPEVSGGKTHNFYLLGWLDGAYDTARCLMTNIQTYDSEKGSGGWNGARFSDSEIDAIIDKAATIVDLKERDILLQKANQLVKEKIPVIPLHYQMDIYAVQKNKNIDFSPRPDRWLVYKEISID